MKNSMMQRRLCLKRTENCIDGWVNSGSLQLLHRDQRPKMGHDKLVSKALLYPTR